MSVSRKEIEKIRLGPSMQPESSPLKSQTIADIVSHNTIVPIEVLNPAPVGNPLVSVIVPTYNHEAFIAQCLDSILAQVAPFPFEILIGEDESNDGTREICKRYLGRNRDRISLLLNDRRNNTRIDDRPSGRFNFICLMAAARGRYVAFCEGDDFWSDPYKLQKQVGFLESHPEFFLCGHFVRNIEESGALLPDQQVCLGDSCPEIFTVKEALGGTPLHASSWLYRRFRFEALEKELILKLPAADDLMALMLLRRGPGYCFQHYGSCYRRHSQGYWSTKTPLHKYFDLLQFRFVALKLLPTRHIAAVSLRILIISWKILACALGASLRTKSLKSIDDAFALAGRQRLIPEIWLGGIFSGAILSFPAYLSLKFVQRAVQRALT